MPKNFKVTTKGPTVPTGVNQKSFVSVKVGPLNQHLFKNGNVAKITGGKLRLRNEEDKSFTSDNSEYAAKDDIVEFTGNVIGVNEDKNDAASCRVFTSLSYKPSKPDAKK